jgi:hypothetical protein
VRVIAGWYDGDLIDEPFEYDTHGKPCGLVVERAVVRFDLESPPGAGTLVSARLPLAGG